MIESVFQKHRTPTNAAYDLFIAAASALAVFNVVLLVLARNEVVDSVIIIIELFLSAVFLLDFLARLRVTTSKSNYVLREFGWADLLSAVPIPGFKLLRLFFLARTIHVLRNYSVKRLLQDFAKHRAAGTLLVALVLILLLMELGGIAIVIAERGDPNANIKTGADAIWWIMVTITTVGYGDRYPVTQAGRLIGMSIMVAGVGVFGVFSGFLANFFLSAKPLEEIEASKTAADAGQAGQTGQAAQIDRLAELQRLLEEQEKTTQTLKAKLAELTELQQRA